MRGINSKEPGFTKRARPSFRRRLGDDSGGVTVEFVIWFPFLLLLATLIVDLSMIFTTNARMYDAARDAARRMALHRATAAEAEAYVYDHMLFGRSQSYSVEAIDDTDVSVTVTTTLSSASIFGAFASLLPRDLTARVVMMKEPE